MVWRKLFRDFSPGLHLIRAPLGGLLFVILGGVMFLVFWAFAWVLVHYPLHVCVPALAVVAFCGYVQTIIAARWGAPPDPEHYTSAPGDEERAKRYSVSSDQ